MAHASPPTPATPPARPLLLGIGLLVSALCGAAPMLVVPEFKQVFVSFGGDLPLATQMLIDYPWALCALPVLVLGLWALTPRRRRDSLACVSGVLLGLAVIPLTAFVLYLPIFMLAATV